jgi:hypothetical protein
MSDAMVAQGPRVVLLFECCCLLPDMFQIQRPNKPVTLGVFLENSCERIGWIVAAAHAALGETARSVARAWGSGAAPPDIALRLERCAAQLKVSAA